MHRKVHLLVLAGIITTNTLTPIGPVFANEIGLENILTEEGTNLDKWEYSEETKEDTEIENIKRDNEGWITASSFPELDALWDCTFDEANQTIILNGFKDIRNQTNGDIKVEIPRSVGGYRIALADLNSDMFPGVTHIMVAETKGNEGQVKVLATELTRGFRDNKTLKYANFDGLDVSGVNDMTELFSMCDNLKIINISDWVIKDSTSISGMFYGRMKATNSEKNILVISNDARISRYDFIASNRIPCTVLFSAEGGYFLGHKDILNMAVTRFTIRPELLDNLSQMIEEDLIFAGKPVRDGYEFKGWYTDDPTPTNFYELLNMTYKARWEKVEETPVVKDYEVEANSGNGGSVNTPAIIKVNNLKGLRYIIEKIVDENKMSVGISDRTEENDIISYNLDVIDGRNAYHIVLKVDKTNTAVTSILDDMYNQNDSEDKPETDVTPEEQPPIVPNPPVVTPPSSGNTENNKPSEPVVPEVKPPVEEEQPEEQPKPNQPSIFDKIDENIVTVEKGEGNSNNPLVLTVKPVEVAKLNTFLNSLSDLSPIVVSVTKGKTHTEYKLEVDNVNTFINRMFKVRLASRTTYVTIKVANGETNLLKALNKFSKGTNAQVSIPTLVTFTDVSSTFWAKANIENFASMGLINGYKDGTFKPNQSITRAEFVKIVNDVFGYTKQGAVSFTDVKKGEWYYNDIAIAIAAGYINGKTVTTFAPNDKITRQEVAKILTTIMKKEDTEYDKINKFKDGNKTADWAKSYVEGAIEAGYLSGDTQGNLNPTNNITRAEAVTVLSRIKK